MDIVHRYFVPRCVYCCNYVTGYRTVHRNSYEYPSLRHEEETGSMIVYVL